ncbi:SXL [Symbiodinium pilosum]|uniref:SXL protein n=1 Tax=Symbiodinium pilosum TaxID=2952 RepID=A0A812V2Z0_SYMPI|nr:SXL [Symbiodinium pilosum]
MAAVPPSEELFVTGLPMNCTSELSKQVFSQYGAVKETTVLPVSPGKQAAAGFVVMGSLEDAKWVVEHVNGNVPQGLSNPVTVVFATPKIQRPGGKEKMMMKGMGKGKGMPPEMMAMMGMMMSMMGKGGGGWGGSWGKGGGHVHPPGKYKTMLCRDFEATGQCSRGESCTFAHGPADLRGGKAA